MSAIVNFSLDLSKLPKEKMVKGKKGTYINLSLSVNDETNEYGSNASVTLSQTKEERDAKQKNYTLVMVRLFGQMALALRLRLRTQLSKKLQVRICRSNNLC